MAAMAQNLSAAVGPAPPRRARRPGRRTAGVAGPRAAAPQPRTAPGTLHTGTRVSRSSWAGLPAPRESAHNVRVLLPFQSGWLLLGCKRSAIVFPLTHSKLREAHP